MKKLLTFTITCVIAIAVMAQENLVVKYSVSNRDTDSGKPYAYEMVLVANPRKSLFYDTESLYCDSCNSTPEGKAKLHEIQMKAWKVVHPDGTVTMDGRKLGLAPEKKQYLYVAKDNTTGILTVYDYKGENLVYYTEPVSEIEWTIIEDSTKIILGYECEMAKANYHGRIWTVWFTPEIPIHDGPWKLRGLPGAILSADGGDDFHIDTIEIGHTSQDVPDMYLVSDYEKGERKRILADHEHYINNLESIMAAQGVRINGDGSPANLPKFDRQRRSWETDY